MGLRPESDLRPSQREIIDGFLASADQIVVADMGGGKTAASLTAFAKLKALGDVRRGIILAPPLPAATVWPREPAKWAHLQGLTIEHVDGTPDYRMLRFYESTADLLVVSIYQTAWLKKALSFFKEDHPLYDLLLVDEISKFRGPRSKLARALEPVLRRFRNRWGLTGTPKPNGYEDLYKPYEFISGGTVWGGVAFDQWRRENFMPMDRHGYVWKVHGFAARRIDRAIANWTTTVDVNLDLPPFSAGADWDIEVDLADDCRTAYDAMLKEFIIEHGVDDPIAAGSAAIQSGKLSQLTQGFVYQREVDEEGDAETKVAARYANAKIAALKSAVEDITEPVIVCYQYRESLEQLLDLFGADTPYIGGGVSAERKMRAVDDFAAGRLPLLLVHPASMGHGVDGLQKAGRLFIWYDLPWSSEAYSQTLKRLDRPGQKRPVISRRIVAKGTVDEVKRARVEGKGAAEIAWIQMLSERGLA